MNFNLICLSLLFTITPLSHHTTTLLCSLCIGHSPLATLVAPLRQRNLAAACAANIRGGAQFWCTHTSAAPGSACRHRQGQAHGSSQKAQRGRDRGACALHSWGHS